MENLIAELTSKINSIIDSAQQQERVLTPEEEKQLAMYSAKLELLKKYSPKDQVAPIVMSEKKLAETERFNFIKKPTFNDQETNYISGLFYLSVLKNDQKAKSELNSFGIKMAMNEGTGSAGGFLVPRDMMKKIIELFEEYGDFRPNAFKYPLGTLNTDVPIGNALVTAEYVNEGVAFTPKDAAFSQVTLTPKKLGVLMVLSKELDQDQVVALGDYLNRLVARSVTYKEDDTGFNGDGTAGYGSMSGLKSELLAGSIVTASAKKFESLTLTDFQKMIAKLPRYALKNAKWYISNYGFAMGMLRLATAGGGNAISDFGTTLGLRFLGYPVVISPVLPLGDADAVSTILVYFGDLSQTAIFGDRRQLEIATSEDRYFELYQIGMLAVERIAIKVFNPGTSSAPGAMVALKTPAT